MSLTLEDVTDRLRERAGQAEGLGKTAKLDFGSDGVVHLDARKSPPEVSNDDHPADATLRLTLDDLRALAKGELDPMRALFTRRLKLQGDKGLAMKLASIFRESRT